MQPASGASHRPPSRHLKLWLAFLLLLAACASQPAAQTNPEIPLQATITPLSPLIPVSGLSIPCTAPASLTVAETEGPYFKAGSPETATLVTSDTKGTRLVLSGYVLTSDCHPIEHALLDFWQANSDGQYDNSGYILRGHQFTDANGQYTLTTIVPGLYPGRTEHIHVKVQAPGGPVLTTQLFFPDVVENSSDGIFDPSLLLRVQPASDGETASFNFIINQQ